MHVLKVVETVATAVSLLKDLDTLVPVAVLGVNWGHGVKTIGFGENEMAHGRLFLNPSSRMELDFKTWIPSFQDLDILKSKTHPRK